MPRVARIYQKAVCYHLMNRGINRQPVFDDESDYVKFGELVREHKGI
jgi:REP element-mobilizing transposase RayT